MKKFLVLVFLALVSCTALVAAPLPENVPAQAAPIPVLLIDGESGGPYHAWQSTTAAMKKELDDAGIFNVTIATSPKFGEDFSNFKPDFSAYRVIVMNYDAPDWPANLREQFEQYVKNGGGLVVVHAADNSFPNWQAFNDMIGIGGWRGRTEKAGPLWYFKDGKLVSDNTPGSAGEHGLRLPFQVETRAPEHPIMKGLPRVWMHAPDELYATLRGPGQNMTVLATAHSDPKNSGTDRDEPMLMVLSYGKGRVFHTTMGHDVEALSCIGFTTTFQRGTEWAATGRVTQKVPANFPTATSVSFQANIAELDPDYQHPPAPSQGAIFDFLADSALAQMKKRAEELGIGGVAVVAYFDGDQIQSWRSKLLVVGRMKDEPTADNTKGANLIGIAYAKASEMADTLKNSGSNVRPPMVGEFGWTGGVIERGKHGYVIAAFSGGKSEQDVQVSHAGVDQLKTVF